MSGIDEAVEFAIETTTAILGPGGELDASAAAFHRALRERGYVVVPVEPTGEMLAACNGALSSYDPHISPKFRRTLTWQQKAIARYRAMIGSAK